ncbi:hypothetical protein J4E85_010457 [Alternaria conjuncta]|uniref:uncharacterized protein n=1 Tax=Alternaria conjuncta TaxID=181017 RepID=UPI00221FEAB8|nr:uncharacterized protein J4E85_010457 [Alternaria conjuncta]KAI4915332.1 hypothetical protein J4E85_010457 [Alternaria conjuncta]
MAMRPDLTTYKTTIFDVIFARVILFPTFCTPNFTAIAIPIPIPAMIKTPQLHHPARSHPGIPVSTRNLHIFDDIPECVDDDAVECQFV